MEELNKSVAEVNLHENTNEETDVPDDIRKLIEETVNESSTNVEKTENEPSKAVKSNQLKEFFLATTKIMGNKESIPDMRAKVVEAYPGSDPQLRMQAIRTQIEHVYDGVWKDIGVDLTIAQRAVAGVQKILTDEEIDLDYREEMKKIVIKFKSCEDEVVGRLLFGDEAFESRKKQQVAVEARCKVLENELSGMSKPDRGKKILELKQKGFEMREKLMKMGGTKAAQYLKDMKGQEADVMNDLSALAMLIQSGSGLVPQSMMGAPGQGGHSHGGKACQGHGGGGRGGHSHGGGGGGGHSHGGKACQGHGGQSHGGHSH